MLEGNFSLGFSIDIQIFEYAKSPYLFIITKLAFSFGIAKRFCLIFTEKQKFPHLIPRTKLDILKILNKCNV